MKQSKLELLVGAFVLAGLLAVAFLAVKIGAGTLTGSETYSIKARFSDIGGISPGSNVLISGVPVGRVGAITLDQADFSAIVELRLDKVQAGKLSADTIASIKSTGIIGDKYVSLSPGSDTEILKPGDTITNTEPSVDLMSLIGKMAFGSVTSKAGSGK